MTEQASPRSATNAWPRRRNASPTIWRGRKEAIHRAVLDHLTYLADHGLPMVTNKAIAEAVGCKTPHKVDNALQRVRGEGAQEGDGLSGGEAA